MKTLYDGDIIILSKEDLKKEDLSINGIYRSIPDYKLLLRANYALYYDQETSELTVFKERKPIKKL